MMRRKKVLISLAAIALVVIAAVSVPAYYALRYPYYVQHAEQTSLSRHWWEPLLLVMQGNPSDRAEEMLAIDCEAYQGHWPEVQRLTMDDAGSDFKAYYHNLALARQGHLADSLLSHYAPFERALFLPVDETGNYLRFLAAGEAWWAVGDLTMAEHATMLGLIFSPRHTGTRALRRLAEINIAQGDSAAASKYLHILRTVPRHRAWAESMTPRLEGLQLCDGRDTLRLSQQYQRSLRNVLDNQPANWLAHEYLLCLDLLMKDLVSFRADVERYGYTRSRLYEEAVLILMAGDEELRETWYDRVTAETYEDFVRFNTRVGQQAPIAAMSEFRHTYWYYFRYAKHNEPS